MQWNTMHRFSSSAFLCAAPVFLDSIVASDRVMAGCWSHWAHFIIIISLVGVLFLFYFFFDGHSFDVNNKLVDNQRSIALYLYQTILIVEHIYLLFCITNLHHIQSGMDNWFEYLSHARGSYMICCVCDRAPLWWSFFRFYYIFALVYFSLSFDFM